MISIQNVSRRFGETIAVDALSLDIDRGEVLGFLGPNGAGKSTTIRMVTGFLAPDEGSILFDGVDIREDSLSIRSRIGYLPENNPLYPDMTVAEYLSFSADLRGLTGPALREHLARTVEETGITHVYNRPIGELSKGFRQRTGLAAAILHQPDVLIMDEPTEGLDPNQRQEIRNLIRGLGAERTVVMSTHVLQEVSSTCSRIAIISEGRLAAEGSIDELLSRSRADREVVVELLGADSQSDALASLAGVAAVTESGGEGGRRRYHLTVTGGDDVRPEVFSLAIRNGWTLFELFERAGGLEDVFRHLTLDAADPTETPPPDEGGAG